MFTEKEHRLCRALRKTNAVLELAIDLAQRAGDTTLLGTLRKQLASNEALLKEIER